MDASIVPSEVLSAPARPTLADIAAALYHQGYTVMDGALPAGLADNLLAHFRSLEGDHFHRAGIGREADFHLNRFVRTDHICWLEGESPGVRAYLDWMEGLRLALNRRLFLGLFDYECHYAWYPQGAFYKRHVDAFRGRSSRVVTTVLYLNPGWQPQDGGELVIYPAQGEGELERVQPLHGRLVVFLSEEFPHEVLPVNRPRYSVTGWFRVNGSVGGIDPPA